MKLTAFLLATVISAGAFGQETEKKTNTPANFKKVQIGISFSPDYCYRILHKAGDMDESDIKALNKTEIGKFGYTTGLNIIFNLNKTIGIETGINYSDKGYQTRTLESIYVNDWIYFRPNISPAKINYVYDKHYLDFPLKVNFTLGTKKLRFTESTGLITNVYRLGIYEINDETNNVHIKRKYTGHNMPNLSLLISAGVDWKMSSKSDLKIEPVFRCALLNIDDNFSTTYLWSIGLNVSYYFGL